MAVAYLSGAAELYLSILIPLVVPFQHSRARTPNPVTFRSPSTSPPHLMTILYMPLHSPSCTSACRRSHCCCRYSSYLERMLPPFLTRSSTCFLYLASVLTLRDEQGWGQHVGVRSPQGSTRRTHVPSSHAQTE